MKFTQDDTGGSLAIQGYAEGQITINGVQYRSSLILTPDKVLPEWRPTGFTDLLSDDFLPLIELQPELILLGTGACHQFPHPSLTSEIIARRIGLEAMETAAACRTYNILMAEGRRVAAALLMI
jgi:uncharacterized protein